MMTVCGDPVIVTTEIETGLDDADEVLDNEAEVEEDGNEKVEDDVVIEDVGDDDDDVGTSDVADSVTSDLVIIVVEKVVGVANVDDLTELIDTLLEMEDCNVDVDAKEDVYDVWVDEKSALVDNEACAMPLGLLSKI